MKLSVVIVNYNVRYFLEQCLHACANAQTQMKQHKPEWDSEIWVVDNNSVDGSVQMVKERFAQVRLIANKDNKGFSKANNQAMALASGEYVLLLNPDTVVEEDTFVKSVAFMDTHPDAGGLGVKMLDGKGQFLPESKRGFPAPDVAFYKIFGLSSLFPRSKIFGKYHLGFLDSDKTHQIEVLAGAFMLLRAQALQKVGYLDETFFMYGEDIDLSYRLIQGGYRNYYYPETKIIHYKGESTKKDSVNYVFVFYKAMVIFAKKHFSANNARLFSFLINAAIYIRAGLSIATRCMRSLAFPLLDFALILTLLRLVGHWYERNIKFANGDYYPDDFFNFILPLYASIWVLANSLFGGYKWMYQLSRLLKGVALGTLLITFLYAFLNEDLRFSRAMIILGAGAALAAGFALRWFVHLITEGHPYIGRIKTKRMAIIGGMEEAERVNDLLGYAGIPHEVVGFLSPDLETGQGFIGTADQINQVVKIHRVDEVIFCSKDLKASEIFNYMLQVEKGDVQFKIVPEESVFIIGSNSKNHPGDYYTIDVKLALKSPENQFNKRSLDIMVSAILLLLYPVAVWWVDHKKQFTLNLVKVFLGRYTWVGYGSNAMGEGLPKIKKGILRPVDGYRNAQLEIKAIQRIDLAYARNYHISKDLYIIAKGFSRLGNAV
ncbi:MAG: glycosyltransferase [Bacteroidetes bacterium]|nr:glycosyltransferase [Bacteroidota bacterium]